MIMTEKIRSMSDVEKFHHFLKLLAAADTSENMRADAVEMISKLMQGCRWNEIDKKFNVKVKYDLSRSPALVTITLPDSTESITFDLVVSDRDQFEGAEANVVDESAPRSMLDAEEKKEIDALVNSK